MFESGQLTVLNMKDILPNRFQPRIRFDEEKLEELAESIGKYGVIQPIVVRPVGGKFEIIAGERRYKASKLANKSTIPAIIINLSDKDSEEIALLENIQRQELSPIEEAVSYKRILDMGYITQEGLAKKLGKSQSTIANKIRLLNLDDEVQSYLLNNKISERHARSLLRIPDKEAQVHMLHRIVSERLTVKQTDREIEKLKEKMDVENKEVQPVTIEIPKNEQVNSAKTILNTPDEIESLFDDDDIKNVQNERGNNMDIDRIMREAKDINVQAPEAPKDISGLMYPGNDVQSEPIVREDVNQPDLENNRFINVTPQSEYKPVQSSPVQSSGVTFDSMFNQHVNITPASSNVVENSGANTFSTNVTPQNNQVDTHAEVSGIPEIAVSSEEEVSDDTKKVISSAVADALKRFNQKKVKQNGPSQNVQPNVSLVQSVPEVSEPVNTSISSEVNSIPADNVNSVPEPSVSQISEPGIPSTDIIADNSLNKYTINPDNQTETMASTITQDVKPINNQAHFAQIVKLLRECANQIEQNGYYVNVDELDLGNQYKVTFTINKE